MALLDPSKPTPRKSTTGSKKTRLPKPSSSAGSQHIVVALTETIETLKRQLEAEQASKGASAETIAALQAELAAAKAELAAKKNVPEPAPVNPSPQPAATLIKPYRPYDPRTWQ